MKCATGLHLVNKLLLPMAETSLAVKVAGPCAETSAAREAAVAAALIVNMAEDSVTLDWRALLKETTR